MPPTCEYPILCPLLQGTRTDFGAQGSVNDPFLVRLGGDGCNPIVVPFVVKGNGNKTVEILLLVRSDSMITGGCRVVDVKLVQLRPGLCGEVLVWLKGPIFFLREPEPFDMVKDAVSAFDGSLYLVHVLLLICLNVGYLSQDFFVVDWALAWHKQFDFRNVESWVCSPLVGKRYSYRCGGDELLYLKGTNEFVVQLSRGPFECEVGG